MPTRVSFKREERAGRGEREDWRKGGLWRRIVERGEGRGEEKERIVERGEGRGEEENERIVERGEGRGEEKEMIEERGEGRDWRKRGLEKETIREDWRKRGLERIGEREDCARATSPTLKPFTHAAHTFFFFLTSPTLKPFFFFFSSSFSIPFNSSLSSSLVLNNPILYNLSSSYYSDDSLRADSLFERYKERNREMYR